MRARRARRRAQHVQRGARARAPRRAAPRRGADGAHARAAPQVSAFSTSSTERAGRREVAAAAGTGFSPEGADISIIRITDPRRLDGSGGGGGGEADVAALTRPGTGNNAFPSYGPDGSEARRPRARAAAPEARAARAGFGRRLHACLWHCAALSEEPARLPTPQKPARLPRPRRAGGGRRARGADARRA